MQGAEVLIPILVPIAGCAMIFGIVYLRTRENLAMLERGKDPRSPRPYRNLKNGLLFTGAGIGLLLAYLLDVYMLRDIEENPAIYFALIAIGGGLGLISSYRIEKKEVNDKGGDFDKVS